MSISSVSNRNVFLSPYIKHVALCAFVLGVICIAGSLCLSFYALSMNIKPSLFGYAFLGIFVGIVLICLEKKLNKKIIEAEKKQEDQELQIENENIQRASTSSLKQIFINSDYEADILRRDLLPKRFIDHIDAHITDIIEKKPVDFLTYFPSKKSNNITFKINGTNFLLQLINEKTYFKSDQKRFAEHVINFFNLNLIKFVNYGLIKIGDREFLLIENGEKDWESSSEEEVNDKIIIQLTTFISKTGFTGIDTQKAFIWAKEEGCRIGILEGGVIIEESSIEHVIDGLFGSSENMSGLFLWAIRGRSLERAFGLILKELDKHFSKEMIHTELRKRPYFDKIASFL